MPRIDRYILTQFLTLFGFFALVLVSVYWINRAVSLFEQMISDGQSALVVIEFTALTLPLVISVVLPIAAFAGSAYGTNRMSSESELVAMQAAGMSPWRLARPVLLYGLIIGVMSAVLVHGLVPAARAKMADRQAELAENVTTQFLRPGSFQFPADGMTLFLSNMTADGKMQDIFLEDERDPNSEKTYSASEAILVKTDTGPKLVMLRGSIQTLERSNGKQRLSLTRFEDMTYDLAAMLGPSKTKSRDIRTYSTMSLLWPSPEMLEITGSTPLKTRAEGLQRLAKPLMTPVAAMLGFAMLLLGTYSRFGVWRQLFYATIVLIVLQFLETAASGQVGRSAALWPLTFLPALLGAAICVGALWFATRRRKVPEGSPA